MTMENRTEEPHASSPHSLAELLRDLREEGTTLLRQEVDLAKSEMSEKADQLTSNGVKIGIGAGVAGAGLLILLIGISYLMSHMYLALGLSAEVSAWLGPVTVGLLTALIGWGLIAKARSGLKSAEFAPKQTLGSLRDTKAWAQRKLHAPNHEPAV